MAKKDFLDRMKNREQACFDVGEEMGIQRVWDAIQLALRDPYVVGKKKWGRKKIARLYEKVVFYKNYFNEAFTLSPEADVKQEEQDSLLREIWGDELVPHRKRYPYQKEFDYSRSRKEWR
jgi:hypothetical protein